MRPEPAIPARVLDAAADWLLRLHEAPHDGDARAACLHWCAQHPDHARAWQRAQRLQTLLQQVPPALALPVLGRGADLQRRAALKRIGLWLTLMPAGWLGWQVLTPAPPGTSVRTAVGERRTLALPDGSEVQLDTDTHLRVQFDGRQRGLHLERGRIRVTSAEDPVTPARPLQVHTPHGRVRALGTRFDVQVDDGSTALVLLEGQLEITAGEPPPWRLEAGQQAVFGHRGRSAVGPLDDTRAAWTDGMLIADNRTLGDLLGELARYRRGWLRCDPQVAALRVSGAFPTGDSERSLALLEATYPIRVQHAAGGLWTTVVPR